MSNLPLPEHCPNPSVHGHPFRYCPTCSWTESPAVPAPQVLTDEELNRFGYHPPKDGAAVIAHELVRREARAFASALASVLPAGRHRDLALTAVQEAMMWANAAIACDLNPPSAEG